MLMLQRARTSQTHPQLLSKLKTVRMTLLPQKTRPTQMRQLFLKI